MREPHFCTSTKIAIAPVLRTTSLTIVPRVVQRRPVPNAASGATRCSALDGGAGDIQWFHDSQYCEEDTDHGWVASHHQWNAGKNDGFAITNASNMPVCAAATYPPNTLPKETVKPTSSISAAARAVF